MLPLPPPWMFLANAIVDPPSPCRHGCRRLRYLLPWSCRHCCCHLGVVWLFVPSLSPWLLLSPWLVLAFVPFLALILSPSLLPPWTLLARATCSCKNWVLGPKATPPFIHAQSANFTNNIHIKLRTLNLRGDFWKSGLSCSSHC